ncbi:MAG TPA: leucine--tRNA ligase [Anaerolineae bacterium]|nr:leucine--tRNA ligase [Anaerolineae bacterium]
MHRERYDPRTIEPKWQRIWAQSGLYRVDLHRAQRPFYNLMEFPYPSAEALHVGHVYTYSGADTYGRYRRLCGDDVFEPIGFDAFGIHSENYALRVGRHPMGLTAENTERYQRQMQELGTLFDWSRAVDTSRPEYYRWTQWVFLQLFKAGLAYRAKAPVNWCPSCLTVLANEQVIGGLCERCDTAVVQKEMEQWFLRITAYADRLLAGHEQADFPATTVTLQRNWIGRSEGAEIRFQAEGGPEIPVFTTRPDTLFGATYLVLAPEHPAVAQVTTPGQRAAVQAYAEQARGKRELERVAAEREKTGVSTGGYAVNPANGERIPIWVADYVLVGYGTGAIMAVPAHDERDFAFARAHNLPIRVVIAPPAPSPYEGEGRGEGERQARPPVNQSAGPLTLALSPAGERGQDPSSPLVGAKVGGAYTGEGVLINSGPFDGMPSQRAKAAITATLEERGQGGPAVTYRLRDWLISRQRYWGPPIPIVYCERCGIVPVPEEDLPVRLPYVADFRPQGGGASPLAAVPEFVHTACPECGGPARRETDVSDTFLDSAWYFLRYPSAHREDAAFDRALTHKWLPVDLYAGGIEHSTLHHLYARFITMALHDLGYLDFEEPFKKLRLHGLIVKDGAKMSKSRGNVVNPDEYVHRYGADTLRLYLLFLGPYEEGGDFTDTGIRGITRFLNRAWALVVRELPPTVPPVGGDRLSPPSALAAGPVTSLSSPPVGGTVGGHPTGGAREEALVPMHRAIAEVQADIEALHFHTAIAALMSYSNWLAEVQGQLSPEAWHEALRTFIILLAPFAPHIAEELWEREGMPYSVHQQRWPAYNPRFLVRPTVTLVIQVDGKVRDRMQATAGLSEAQARDLALASEKVQRVLDGREVADIIVVPDRLVNVVTKG